MWKYTEWDDIVNETMIQEELDEHVIKLVQIVHELAKDTKDPEKEKLYKSAANVALTCPHFCISYEYV